MKYSTKTIYNRFSFVFVTFEKKKNSHTTASTAQLSLWFQEDYTTDEEALAAHGVKGGAGGILDLLKASKQVAGLDSAAIR